MKRSVAALAVIATFASAFALGSSASAGPMKHSRVIEAGYVTPFLTVYPLPVGYSNCAEGIGCYRFTPRAKERWIEVEVEDVTGGEVYFFINQDVDGDGAGDVPDGLDNWCGSTDEPVPVAPRKTVRIWIMAGPWAPCTASTPTNGSITIKLSH